MKLYTIRHQARGMLLKSIFSTEAEAREAAAEICAAEIERPSYLKSESSWWCACAVEIGDGVE